MFWRLGIRLGFNWKIPALQFTISAVILRWFAIGPYQIIAGYEAFKDADFLRIDPALRLAIIKMRLSGGG